MSALVLLGCALLVSVFAARIGEGARAAWLRAFGKGLSKSAMILFVTLLIASALVYGYGAIAADKVETKTLLQLEAALDEAQRWRRTLLGPWDWKLIVGGAVCAFAGVLFAMPEASRAYDKLKLLRTPATVLSLLAGLTVSTVAAGDAMNGLALRFAESKGRIASDASAVKAAVEEQVREAVLDVASIYIWSCAAEDEEAVCALLERGHFPPPPDWLRDHPDVARVFNGVRDASAPPGGGGEIIQPVSTPFEPGQLRAIAPSLSQETAATMRMLTEYRFAREDRLARSRGARDDLVNLAIDAGFETALDAARDAGASGDLVEALLTPLMAGALKKFVGAWTNAALAHAFDKDSSALKTFTTETIRAEFATAADDPDVRAQLRQARHTCAQTVARAEALGGEDLANWRAEQHARYAGGGDTGYTGPGWPSLTPDPFGQSPGTGSNVVTVPGQAPGQAGVKVPGRPIR